MMHTEHHETTRTEWRAKIAWVVLAVVAAFFLLSEHRAHFLGALPYLLLLACPLMHLFMHHGHHGSHSEPKPGNAPESKETHHEP
ncbi:MAG: DUF2933 domain-containing protein [Sterolibacterium sp.]